MPVPINMEAAGRSAAAIDAIQQRFGLARPEDAVVLALDIAMPLVKEVRGQKRLYLHGPDGSEREFLMPERIVR